MGNHYVEVLTLLGKTDYPVMVVNSYILISISSMIFSLTITLICLLRVKRLLFVKYLRKLNSYWTIKIN